MKKPLDWFYYPMILAATALLTAGCDTTRRSSGAIAPSESAEVKKPFTQTKESQAAMTPSAALAELRAGNARFVAGQPKVRNLPAKAQATASGQYPFAVVLSCLDSRQPVELVFDQGIGDIFNARVAGNVLNDDILGSLEFACIASGAKLIVVSGHSNCGAVKGAIDGVKLGFLTGLLARIKPAIAAVPDDGTARNSANLEFVQKAGDANVHLVMRQIREQSPALRKMIEQGKIGLVGAMYDLGTGEVHFFQN